MNSRRFWIILHLSPQYFREIPEGPRNLFWTTKLQITNRVLREVSEKNTKREKSCRTFWTVNIRRPAITLVVICSIFTCEALEATWMRCSCGGQTDRQTSVFWVMNCLISWSVPLQWSLQAQQVPLEPKGHPTTAPVYHFEVQVSQLSPKTLSSAAYRLLVTGSHTLSGPYHSSLHVSRSQRDSWAYA